MRCDATPRHRNMTRRRPLPAFELLLFVCMLVGGVDGTVVGRVESAVVGGRVAESSSSVGGRGESSSVGGRGECVWSTGRSKNWGVMLWSALLLMLSVHRWVSVVNNLECVAILPGLSWRCRRE